MPGSPSHIDQHDPGSKPWRLGLLTLLAAAVVVIGVVVFGGGDTGSPEDPGVVADSGTVITIPPLPAAVRGAGAAPDFSLELFDGTRFSLGTHLEGDGRPLILNLWASWCPPCREEMPDLDAAARANPGVVILGVAVDDDPIAAEAFAVEISIEYPVGFDEADRVGRSYPTSGLPATFVISADGMLLRTVFGRLAPADIDELITLALAG
ncbi:MAG: TlpA family protein disulfide reductase [Acidimicrobiia bacterium]|nr:TlpA family protein disulfide reductase [Acidimicrobiia bacterium]